MCFAAMPLNPWLLGVPTSTPSRKAPRKPLPPHKRFAEETARPAFREVIDNLPEETMCLSRKEKQRRREAEVQAQVERRKERERQASQNAALQELAARNSAFVNDPLLPGYAVWPSFFSDSTSAPSSNDSFSFSGGGGDSGGGGSSGDF